MIVFWIHKTICFRYATYVKNFAALVLSIGVSTFCIPADADFQIFGAVVQNLSKFDSADLARLAYVLKSSYRFSILTV